MAFDVLTNYSSGQEIYFVIYDTDGLYWNGNSWVSRNSLNWQTYAQTLIETDQPGIYSGSFPETIGAGLYYLIGYKMSGIYPISSDEIIRFGTMDWTGSEEWSGGIAFGSNLEVNYTLGVGVTDDGQITTGIVQQGQGITILTGVK